MKKLIPVIALCILMFESFSQTTSNPLYLNYNSTLSSATYISSTGGHGNQPKMFFHLPYVGITGDALFEWDADDSGNRSALYQFKASSDRIFEFRGWNDGKNSELWFGDEDDNKFSISDLGNVGIGISNPISQFHVYSSSSNTSSNAGLTVEEDGPGDALIQYLLTGEQRWVSGIDNSDNNKFIVGRGTAWTTGKDLIIDNTGKFGLGVLYPREKLDVNGSVVIQANNLDGKDLTYLANSKSFLIGWNRSRGAGETNFISNKGAGSSGGFDFRDIDNSGQEKLLMRIKGDGKVAIGTTDFSGNHKLRVEGSIGAREIKVEASGWSDFVFENDYDLRTLEEVEKHINENGHLPEIPNEAEVTENGINLGEMNDKLLQKIEELTLYMIDVNKRVNQLETENQELKEKVKNQCD